CYSISNFTESNIQSFELDKTNFTILNKYDFPNYVDLSVNGSYLAINKNQTYILSNNSGSGFSIKVDNISNIKPVNYTTPVSVVSLNLCSYQPTPKTPPFKKPTTPVFLNMSIVNYTITATSTQKNDTVIIKLNGNTVSQGEGSAFVDASWLPAGKYLVEGKDINSGTYINQTLFKPLFKSDIKFTKICENNIVDNYTCTTTAEIISHNNVLSGRLYVNGLYVGSTNTIINYTTYRTGYYTFVFNTTGNSYYGNASITYYYNNGVKTNNYMLPIISIILVSCVVLLLYRRRWITATK
ncbi:MAG: hypothetical protein ACP5M9_04330, partial [Candidatus Micrarchaeia archaeon]